MPAVGFQGGGDAGGAVVAAGSEAPLCFADAVGLVRWAVLPFAESE